MELTVRPIGFVHSPYMEKAEAPRQATASQGAEGRIAILREYEHALSDLEGFERIWVLFWFDRAEGARMKVLPPRSDRRRGLFATRSPHRPNPIGMSAVRLIRVEGLDVFVRDLDMIEGTPVLDIKPYVPYADAFPDAKEGWLDATDPIERWRVTFSTLAAEQLRFIVESGGKDLRGRIEDTLALGPEPHPYRRIRKTSESELVLAVKEWRATCRVDGRSIEVESLKTGYRAKELAGPDETLAVHRAFVARFG